MSGSRQQAYEVFAAHFDRSLGLQRQLRLPRAVVIAIASFSVAMMSWMALAPVDRVVHTQGRVIPSSKQQLVQHLEGGIVSRVFVREGDSVAQGQNLIAVSALQASSTRGEKRARLDGLGARAARLQAEADGAARFAMPAGVDSATPGVRNESDAFDVRQARLRRSMCVVEEQLVQKRQEATEHEVRLRGIRGALDVACQQFALVSEMLSKNAALQLELLSARSRVERLNKQIRESETAVPRLKSAALELQARLAETTALFRSESRTALADTQVELQQSAQELNADEDRVQRTVVVASVAGRVNKLLFNTVGGVVEPGDTLLELTPDDASLVVEMRATPMERGLLQVGLKAVVKAADFDYTVFGTLAGRVTEISPDSLVDERGERYFRVGISVDAQSYRDFGQPLTPGMTVTADAVTGQRTVLQYVLSPIRGIVAAAFRDCK